MRASRASQATLQVKLLRQRKNVYAVVASGHIGLGRERSSSHGASAGRNGDVLPASIRTIMRTFVERSRDVKLIPADVTISNPDYALDPAGAVHQVTTLTKGRTILIGDAGGFVSGSTGEGIYPGMVSGAIAADIVHEALGR